jgi:hypothetical protein
VKFGSCASLYWSLSHFQGIRQGREKSSSARWSDLWAAPRRVLPKVFASSPPPGELSATRAGFTAYPRPALSERTRAETRVGSERARCRATSPPNELPTTTALSTPTASRNELTKDAVKAGE